MIPSLIEKTNRLEFEVLHAGDELSVVTGHGDEAWRYSLTVQNARRWPSGPFTAHDPEGSPTGPYDFEIHGCGQWTTRAQNPVQKQEIAFTPYFDGLLVGRFMLGKFIGEQDRAVFDKPGQEISEILRIPYRENTILEILGGQAGAISVREIVEAVGERSPQLEEGDIRKTLKKLTGSKQVSELRKKTLRYQLV